MATNICDLLAEKLLAEHPGLREPLQNLETGESVDKFILGCPVTPSIQEQVPNIPTLANGVVQDLSPAELGILVAEGKGDYDIYKVDGNMVTGISLHDVLGELGVNSYSRGIHALRLLAAAAVIARAAEMAIKSIPLPA